MIHLEDLLYKFRGFHEGEYMHRYFLPESQQSEISPRDLLVVYWILRSFTIRTDPRQMKPAAFREASSIHHADNNAKTLLESALTINYTQEHLSTIIPVEQVTVIVATCRSYILAITDTELNEQEIDQLISLNKRLRDLQHETTQRIIDINTSILKTGENCNLEVTYAFELCENNPDYREMNHNEVFSFHDYINNLKGGEREAGIEEVQQRDVTDWNNKHHLGNRLYQTPHCWLFHTLEDLSAAPLRHLLRIAKVTAV